LVLLLLLMILAKLAGHDKPEAIADWARLRVEGLVKLLQLKRASMPHATTYGRVIAKAIDPEAFEQEMKGYFAQPAPADPVHHVQVCIDGKQVRGTLAAGGGVNEWLLGAYLPGAGVMLFQVELGQKKGEVTTAPKLLKALDLQGKVVTGDAEFTQRHLSVQIVEAGGEYVWKVKDNQPRLLQEIQDVFITDPALPGFSAPANDFRTCTETCCGHGRIERRTLTASSLLKGYSDWPYLEQVFRLECQVTYKKTGQGYTLVTYGVTSLRRDEADARTLAHYVRTHWAIENGAHYRRDVTFHEDGCRLRRKPAIHVMAILNNIALGLIARSGDANAAHARRVYDAHPECALRLCVDG
jgi:predicted transposase YbfD/YdcC